MGRKGYGKQCNYILIKQKNLIIHVKKGLGWIREMSQQLRIAAALTEDLDLIPSMI